MADYRAPPPSPSKPPSHQPSSNPTSPPPAFTETGNRHARALPVMHRTKSQGNPSRATPRSALSPLPDEHHVADTGSLSLRILARLGKLRRARRRPGGAAPARFGARIISRFERESRHGTRLLLQAEWWQPREANAGIMLPLSLCAAHVAKIRLVPRPPSVGRPLPVLPRARDAWRFFPLLCGWQALSLAAQARGRTGTCAAGRTRHQAAGRVPRRAGGAPRSTGLAPPPDEGGRH